MKTLVALVAVVASVTAASANGVSPNDLTRYVTPNQIAQLSDDEVRQVQGYIFAGKSRSEIRALVTSLLR